VETEGWEVSIEIESAAEVAVFPAESVSVIVTLQFPSARAAKVQALDEIVQETLVDPSFVAVTIAVPANVPATVIVGVLSLVTLSVGELPRSEAIARSGVEGVGKDVALTTTPVSDGELLELTPLMLCCEVKVYVWLASAGEKVHEPDVLEATKIQVTADPLAGVAVTVTVAPLAKPVRSMVGVLSAVMLSVDEIPVSDEDAKSGTDGALMLVLKATSETKEIFPAASLTTMYAFKLLPCVRPVREAVFDAARAVPESDVIALPRATTVAALGAVSPAG
jgi:hypothetical protein